MTDQSGKFDKNGQKCRYLSSERGGKERTAGDMCEKCNNGGLLTWHGAFAVRT